MSFQNRLTLLLFRCAWTLPTFTPIFIQRAMYWLLASFGFLLRTPGVKRLQFNMSRVSNSSYWSATSLGLTWKAIHSYFKYWQQLFAMNSRDKNYVLKHASTENRNVLDSYLEQGKGALIVATHSGNWDMAGAWLGIAYENVVTVAEKLEPVELFHMFVHARKQFHVKIYPHNSSESTVELLSAELAKNNVVGLVADRTLSLRGISVTMFGFPCRLPVGPYALSQTSSVDIIPGAIWFEGNSTKMKLLAPITSATKSAEAVMQEVAYAFEEIISAHPENWHMFQQVWPDHPKKWGGR